MHDKNKERSSELIPYLLWILVFLFFFGIFIYWFVLPKFWSTLRAYLDLEENKEIIIDSPKFIIGHLMSNSFFYMFRSTPWDLLCFFGFLTSLCILVICIIKKKKKNLIEFAILLVLVYGASYFNWYNFFLLWCGPATMIHHLWYQLGIG